MNRYRETMNAYRKIGIKPENVETLGYSDILQNIGLVSNNGTTGIYEKIVRFLRKNKISRLIIPNHYLEHIEHTSASICGIYYSKQAGNMIRNDWGEPLEIKTIIQYTVWAQFSNEYLLLKKKNKDILANRMLTAEHEYEQNVQNSLLEYITEKKTTDGRYIELYCDIKQNAIDYLPYNRYLYKLKKHTQIKRICLPLNTKR